jgi:uncharacterized RDD family membrane protein YckC
MTALLDGRFPVETPEGVTITLTPAGIVPRALAWLVDLMLRGAAYLVGGLLLSLFGKGGTGLFLVFMFLLEWFYPVLFEVLGSGATPGKRVMGLVVVEADGRPVGWSASTVRNLLRFADFLPFGFLAGLLSMLASTRAQRLGDLAAGTLVVYHEQQATIPPAPRDRALEALPPPFALRADEAQALIALVERAPLLSPERIEELAALAPALTGDEPARRRTRLLGIAHYLAGAGR